VIFTVVLASLAILHYFEIIQIPSLSVVEQAAIDKQSGAEYIVYRLKGTGIFNDPNDLCTILVTAMGICTYWITDRRTGLARVFWLAPLGIVGWAIALTYSRGGFMALMAGCMLLFRARFGWVKALVLAAIVLPLLFTVFGGRQTDISTGDTMQERLHYWNEALVFFHQEPLFGIGDGRFQDETRRVCHNSFLESFTEKGIVGGAAFFGIFYLSYAGLRRLEKKDVQILDPELERMRPYLMALVGASMVAMFSLSLESHDNTYLIPGIVVAYFRIVPVSPPQPVLRWSWRLMLRLGIATLGFLVFIHVFVRVFSRYET
jgi:O-antigen ligase